MTDDELDAIMAQIQQEHGQETILGECFLRGALMAAQAQMAVDVYMVANGLVTVN